MPSATRVCSLLVCLCALPRISGAQGLPDERLSTAAELILPWLEEGLCVGRFWESREDGGMTITLERVSGRDAMWAVHGLLWEVAHYDEEYPACRDTPRGVSCDFPSSHSFTEYQFAPAPSGSRLLGVFDGLSAIVDDADIVQSGLKQLWYRCMFPDEATGPSYAPLPFEPYLLVEENEAGETVHVRVHEPPNPPLVQTLRILALDETGATVETTIVDASGAHLSGPDVRQSTWEEIETRFHYPFEGTRIDTVSIETPAGSYDGFQYEVTQPDGTAIESVVSVVSPLTPVREVVRRDGVIVRHTELVPSDWAEPDASASEGSGAEP